MRWAWSQWLGRGPKMAVPIRTMVAPAAMAAWKSALMPMDSVSHGSGEFGAWGAGLERCRETCRTPCPDCCWGWVWSSGHARVHAGQLTHPCNQFRHGFRQRDAGLVRVIVHVHLQAEVQRLVALRADRTDVVQSSPGRPCAPSRRRTAIPRVLFACTGPRKCHSRGRCCKCGDLLLCFLPVVFAEVPQALCMGELNRADVVPFGNRNQLHRAARPVRGRLGLLELLSEPAARWIRWNWLRGLHGVSR